MKIFYTGCYNKKYYTAQLGNGIKIDNMSRNDLFRLWWSVFKRWIRGGKIDK